MPGKIVTVRFCPNCAWVPDSSYEVLGNAVPAKCPRCLYQLKQKITVMKQTITIVVRA